MCPALSDEEGASRGSLAESLPGTPPESIRGAVRGTQLGSSHGRALIDALRDPGSGARVAGVRALGGRSWPDRIVSSSDRLLVIRWDPVLATRAIMRLARCLERIIPVVSVEPPGECAWHDGRLVTAVASDTVLGDFTGCSALFRGRYRTEQALMKRVSSSFLRRGFRCQVATASTVGAVSAVARCMQRMPQSGVHGTGSRAPCIAVPFGRELEFLDAMPIESLRISGHAATALRSVEVDSIGQLARLRRDGIAARLSGGFDDESASGTRPGASSSGSAGTSSKRGRASRGPARSRHVAGTGSWHEQPLLFGDPSVKTTSVDGHAAVAGGCSASASSAPSARARGHRALRSADDALLRLDQALGRDRLTEATAAGERLRPLRTSEPLVLCRDFDGPCSRLDAMVIACGELIDGLVVALGRRREGLRSAVWVFRHASLPTEGIGPGPESRITLECARPSARRAHLWSVFRPKLEKLHLDHGIERIECHAEQTVLLRFRQVALLRSEAMHAGFGPASSAGSGSGGGGHAEWRDLVTAKLGASSIIGVSDLIGASLSARGASLSARGASLPARGASLPARAAWPHPGSSSPNISVATHRPTQVFHPSEPATLLGGAGSESIARSIATRTRWSAPATHQPSDCLAWRGVHWPLQAIDGWEREAGHWLEGTPAVHPVFSRVQIGAGLWLFVRWPPSLPRPPARTTDWISGSSASITSGVALSVLGVWS